MARGRHAPYPRPAKRGEGGEDRRSKPGEGQCEDQTARQIAEHVAYAAMQRMRRQNYGSRCEIDGWPDSIVRQEPIGPYIADFVCREAKLVVEVDGGQHNEPERDQRRDAFMSAEGYRILRFWNPDALTNMDGVLQTILSSLNSSRS